MSREALVKAILDVKVSLLASLMVGKQNISRELHCNEFGDRWI
jgi:hypothetical protein